MKGLELAALYFQEFASPMLKKHFPEQIGRIAAGMLGPGSECLGFDDDTSNQAKSSDRNNYSLPIDLAKRDAG